MRPGRPRERGLLRQAVALLPVFAVSVLAWIRPSPHPGTVGLVPPADTSGHSRLGGDPRVRAFLEAYGPLIDSVSYMDRDVVFTLAGRHIHFLDGRMLQEDRLQDVDHFDSVFYPYPLGPLTRLVQPTDQPRYSADVFAALFGTTESRIRSHCRSISFLGHRMFVNDLILDPLHRVERELREAATVDPAIRQWIADLRITYSFMFREIAGSPSPSLHSFGLAVDLVPSSYGGRHVYWRWSRARGRSDWARIPLDQRWSPPQAVIGVFEANGFVWGGKWSHFDAMHFEYRPEILFFNREAVPSAHPSTTSFQEEQH